jgi:hypothetical protein
MGSTLDNAQDYLNRLSRATGYRKPRKLPPRESKLETAAFEYAESYDCIHYKLNSPGRKGKKDQVFVTPNGYVWWVEFKRKGEPLQKLQRIEAKRMRARFQLVDRFDDLAKFKNKLHDILLLPTRGVPL